MSPELLQLAEAKVLENLHDVLPRTVFESRVQQQAQALLKEKSNYGTGNQPRRADA